jgi:glycine C-acetyltransferase
VINFASYNYLGYSYHPEVIAAAKAALDRYGLGVSSSPVAGGTIQLHKDLEERLLDFIGMDGYGVSLFTAGYSVNSGTIPAFIKPGGHVVVDQSAHMSIMEGAQLSRGEVHYFRHNDVQHLDDILREIKKRGPSRVLVCAEGVYSSDGDYGDIRGIVQTAQRHGAKVLVDEAHSILVAGPGGRGICAEQGVLDQIDLFVITFSKAFGGIGGALIAKKEITQYVNWYARCRMFSCALDPAVTGGILRSLELGMGDDGDHRRKVLRDNAEYLRRLLKDRLNIGSSQSCIIPVIYGSDQRTLMLTDAMQRAGLETSIVQFPAVPKDLSRMRLFVTSDHTRAQIERAADILMQAARQFDFQKV